MSTNNTYCYSLHQMVVGWFRRRPVNPLSFLAPAVKVDGDTGTYDYFPQGYAFRRVDYWRMERAFVMAGKVRFEDAQACRNAAAALANGKVSLIEARRACLLYTSPSPRD